jgi:hypothetical protein
MKISLKIHHTHCYYSLITIFTIWEHTCHLLCNLKYRCLLIEIKPGVITEILQVHIMVANITKTLRKLQKIKPYTRSYFFSNQQCYLPLPIIVFSKLCFGETFLCPDACLNEYEMLFSKRVIKTLLTSATREIGLALLLYSRQRYAILRA